MPYDTCDTPRPAQNWELGLQPNFFGYIFLFLKLMLVKARAMPPNAKAKYCSVAAIKCLHNHFGSKQWQCQRLITKSALPPKISHGRSGYVYEFNKNQVSLGLRVDRERVSTVAPIYLPL